jgi:8-oxo-dGTP diphosphatase
MTSATKAAVGRRGEAAWLRSYDPSDYPPFTVTVDLAVLTIRAGVLCALLVQRSDHPYRGFWALPGGHVLHGHESADVAAARELHEETRIDATVSELHLEQLCTYSDPRRDPRIAAGLHVTSVAYVAFTASLPEPTAGSDAVAARWWPIVDLDLTRQAESWQADEWYDGTSTQLGFDHAVILADAVKRARAKLEYTTLAASFVSEPFTLSDLRRVYDAVWGSAPDLANFRRKVLAVPDFVVPLDDVRDSSRETGGRPPLLYRRGAATLISPPIQQPGATSAPSTSAASSGR